MASALPGMALALWIALGFAWVHAIYQLVRPVGPDDLSPGELSPGARRRLGWDTRPSLKLVSARKPPGGARPRPAHRTGRIRAA